MPDARQVFSRHPALFSFLIIITFLSIAGSIGVAYGFHNLFREHPDDEYGVNRWHFIVFSTAFQIQVYATALMGLGYGVAFLLCAHEQSPDEKQPIQSASAMIWPVVTILSLPPIIANQIAILDACAEWNLRDALTLHGIGLVQSLCGLVVGLFVCYLALSLVKRTSETFRFSQIVVTTAISALLLLIVQFGPMLTPGIGFFVALAWCVLIYALFAVISWSARHWLLLSVAVVLLIATNLREFPHQFPTLDAYYASAEIRPKLPNSVAPDASASSNAQSPTLQKPVTYLDSWKRNYVEKVSDSSKPIFIVVAASGGGYRATYWTASVLDHIVDQKLPGLHDSIGLLTGASGGMVASAYYALRPDDTKKIQHLIDSDLIAANSGLRRYFQNAERDSLTAVIQQLMTGDSILPAYLFGTATDRGQILENQWPLLKSTFQHLMQPEPQSPWRPSLIFSPFLIDSGRALLMSNLDLSDVAHPNSRVVEFFKLFPVQDKFTIATAARMNASFPYISPTIKLPTEPSQRVVDAGYFDNDGVGTATSFLEREDVQEWLLNNARGVVLLRINAFAMDGTQDEECVKEEQPKTFEGSKTPWQQLRNFLTRLNGSVAWLTSPLEGAWAARNASSRSASQLHINALRQLYGERADGGGNFFADIEITNGTHSAMSWHLPGSELQDMERWLGPVCINPGAKKNRAELASLSKLWRESEISAKPLLSTIRDRRFPIHPRAESR